MLPQDFSVQFAYTVQQVVELGRISHLGPLNAISAADRASVRQSLVATNTDGLADRIFNELSGGERQRVLLALALAQESPLILLDELPPYFDYAMTRPIGGGTLAQVTTYALSNLLSAALKLKRCCIVVSNLSGSYEGASNQLRQAIRNFEQEANRQARAVTPVDRARLTLGEPRFRPGHGVLPARPRGRLDRGRGRRPGARG